MKKVTLFLVFTFLFSCQKDTFHIYSKDRKNCITIIDKVNHVRYIANGYQTSIPDTNYVKIDLSSTDRIVTGVTGCWKSENYHWKILVLDNVPIIENKLDPSKFKVIHNYEYDKNFNPILPDFKADDPNYFNIIFEYRELTSVFGNAELE